MKPTPDLCDEYPHRIKVLDPILQNFGGRKQFSGPIVTVSYYKDNSRVKDLLGKAGEGRVLVVDGAGSRRCAYLGDRLAQQASDSGWSGIVRYGCIRDIDEIAAIDIGIKALGAHPIKTEKKGVGETDIAITFGGVTFNSGDYLYADNNGVLIATEALI